jgi:hypothetical protein
MRDAETTLAIIAEWPGDGRPSSSAATVTRRSTAGDRRGSRVVIPRSRNEPPESRMMRKCAPRDAVLNP